MNTLSFPQLLDYFITEELADALYRGNLPITGTKAEKIFRLCGLQTPYQILEFFSAEALRIVCNQVNVQPGRKNEMIEKLLNITDGEIKTTAEQEHQEYLEPTKDNIVFHLKQLKIPSRKARNEPVVRDKIGDHLAQAFEDVVAEYYIGGYLGLKIDLDIGNGKAGIEVKLVNSLLNSASEIQRMIGQSIYYQKKCYLGNLLVAVVGRKEDIDDPILKETYSFLRDFGIECIGVSVN